jgi:hypothetical protein
MDELIQDEDINPDAIIREIGVYASNLEDAPGTHFVVAHWWVVFRDNDWNWWSAEHVGGVLLQRVDSKKDGKDYRKDIERTRYESRGTFITTKLETAAANHRTMKELIDWVGWRSRASYDWLESNCQNFADNLAEYLSGIGVLHTPTSWGAAALAVAVPLAPFWKIGNVVRGLFNRL